MNHSKKKTYLITGAAGFIGSRFVESCQSLGISIISVDEISLFDLRSENLGIDFGEKVDRKLLFAWLEEKSPHLDAIFHLGAITDTRESNLEKLRELNLNYSQLIWQTATSRKIPLIYASSAATYGDGLLGYDDDESLISQLKPLNAYGESKQNFDLWALDQEKKGLCPPSWSGFKFFNVYGMGERHKGFMSSVVLHAYDQISKTGKVTLFRSHKEGVLNGHQKRDFIYVEDVIRVLHFAAETPLQRGIFNLGTGHARTFLDLAKAVFSNLNRKEDFQFIDTPESIRDKYQYFTEARMKKLRDHGYTAPFLSLEEGIKSYVKKLESKRHTVL